MLVLVTADLKTIFQRAVDVSCSPSKESSVGDRVANGKDNEENTLVYRMVKFRSMDGRQRKSRVFLVFFSTTRTGAAKTVSESDFA